jgi:hypothetical protein
VGFAIRPSAGGEGLLDGGDHTLVNIDAGEHGGHAVSGDGSTLFLSGCTLTGGPGGFFNGTTQGALGLPEFAPGSTVDHPAGVPRLLSFNAPIRENGIWMIGTPLFGIIGIGNVTQPDGELTLPLPVPTFSDPALEGAQLFIQTLVLPSSGSSLLLSNATALIAVDESF